MKPAKSQAFVNPRRSSVGIIAALARRLDSNMMRSQKVWAELRRDINNQEHQDALVRVLRRCERLKIAMHDHLLSQISPNQ